MSPEEIIDILNESSAQYRDGLYIDLPDKQTFRYFSNNPIAQLETLKRAQAFCCHSIFYIIDGEHCHISAATLETMHQWNIEALEEAYALNWEDDQY